MLHIVTAYSRPENIPLLYAHLRDEDVIWHPIVGDIPWPVGYAGDWIEPYQVELPAGVDPFAFKMNAFIQSAPIVDSDRYAILNDDDLYAPGLLVRIERMADPVVVVSMLRGDAVPANGWQHPTFPLIAAPENVRVGRIGAEQYFVKGEIFKQLRFSLDRPDCCDGLAAEWLKANYPIRYEPDLYVLFNRLEPGRWAVDHEDTYLLPA
jgi:hypothetical protein